MSETKNNLWQDSDKYNHIWSVLNYKMFEKKDKVESYDRYVLTKDDVLFQHDESQITLECLLVEELIDIVIKDDDIEFVDIALAITDSLKKEGKL